MFPNLLTFPQLSSDSYWKPQSWFGIFWKQSSIYFSFVFKHVQVYGLPFMSLQAYLLKKNKVLILNIFD